MKRILLGLVLAMALSHMAFATVTLKLVSGVTTLQIADGQVAPPGQVDGSGLAGTVLFSGTINGWTVSGATGVTHAPGLVPVGLDLSSLTAACVTGTCAELDVFLSDTGFRTPVPAGGFTEKYSWNITGGGNTSQLAWADSTNTLFGLGAANLIGNIGPVTGIGSSQVNGGPAETGVAPGYSLTIEQIFRDTSGSVQFSVDGSITAVPEPAAVALFGTVLVLCATKLRRRKQLS